LCKVREEREKREREKREREKRERREKERKDREIERDKDRERETKRSRYISTSKVKTHRTILKFTHPPHKHARTTLGFLLPEFGATTAGIVVTLRKILTFGLSFIIFPKPFGALHMAGVALAVAGAALLQRHEDRRRGRRRGR
jgi:hypothetical protein